MKKEMEKLKATKVVEQAKTNETSKSSDEKPEQKEPAIEQKKDEKTNEPTKA